MPAIQNDSKIIAKKLHELTRETIVTAMKDDNHVLHQRVVDYTTAILFKNGAKEADIPSIMSIIKGPIDGDKNATIERDILIDIVAQSLRNKRDYESLAIHVMNDILGEGSVVALPPVGNEAWYVTASGAIKQGKDLKKGTLDRLSARGKSIDAVMRIPTGYGTDINVWISLKHLSQQGGYQDNNINELIDFRACTEANPHANNKFCIVMEGEHGIKSIGKLKNHDTISVGTAVNIANELGELKHSLQVECLKGKVGEAVREAVRESTSCMTSVENIFEALGFSNSDTVIVEKGLIRIERFIEDKVAEKYSHGNRGQTVDENVLIDLVQKRIPTNLFQKEKVTNDILEEAKKDEEEAFKSKFEQDIADGIATKVKTLTVSEPDQDTLDVIAKAIKSSKSVVSTVMFNYFVPKADRKKIYEKEFEKRAKASISIEKLPERSTGALFLSNSGGVFSYPTSGLRKIFRSLSSKSLDFTVKDESGNNAAYIFHKYASDAGTELDEAFAFIDHVKAWGRNKGESNKLMVMVVDGPAMTDDVIAQMRAQAKKQAGGSYSNVFIGHSDDAIAFIKDQMELNAVPAMSL
jgi:hypothetical protein